MYRQACTPLVLATAIVSLTSVSGLAGASEKPASKCVVTFVDLSGSAAKDRALYQADLEKLRTRLQAGDRVVVAPITAKSLTEFRPAVDQEIPTFSMWTDNEIKYKKKVRDLLAGIAAETQRLLASTEKSQKTAVFDALTVAAKLFQGESRRKVLVFFSDMIEDSDRYNFERLQLTSKKIREIVDQHRKSQLLPDLRGVRVYVAGASAASSAKAREVEEFWMTYLRDAGADMDSSHYAHTLLNYHE
jgi:hypothetical protein